MPPVFGRNSSNPHPYDMAINDWLFSDVANLRALARNIMYDRRVSEKREREFNKSCNYPPTAVELNEAIVNYFYQNVRGAKKPHFTSKKLNNQNIVKGIPYGRMLINQIQSLVENIRRRLPTKPKDKGGNKGFDNSAVFFNPQLKFDNKSSLARIIDLNGLDVIYQWAKDAGMQEFASFEGIENTGSWLKKTLQQPEEQVREFINAILKAINLHAKVGPFHPSWATLWTEFAPYASQAADRWPELFGMYRSKFPRWLIVLKYKISEAQPLVCPTQLDAGWSPYFFPTPPQTRMGHPMNLRPTVGARSLLTEIIHKQINHKIEHWDAAGGLYRETANPMSQDLVHQRTAHYKLLIETYGKEQIKEWMPYCY
jgi:hypothetical protein